MRTFLTVSVGVQPQSAQPVFASDDPALVSAVVRALLGRLGEEACKRGLLAIEQQAKHEEEQDGKAVVTGR